MAVTKVGGYIDQLPDGINLAYFVEGARANLISQGHLLKNGCIYIGYDLYQYIFTLVDGVICSTRTPLNPSLVHDVKLTNGKVFVHNQDHDYLTKMFNIYTNGVKLFIGNIADSLTERVDNVTFSSLSKQNFGSDSLKVK